METTEVVAVPAAREKDTGYFVRFSLRQRIEHIVLMTLFVALSVTGLVQRFHTFEFSQWIVLGLGGIETTRLVHRIIGLVFTASMLYHFGYLACALLVRHARPTIIPNLQDFRDTVAEVKHALGFKTARPRFHRYDYRQKFEYVGLMFGSIVLIVTGAMLMFPILVTRIVPGEVLAAAVQFHGYEATLAVLTIIIWHLYNVMFKPDIFPADTSIFTGKISQKRMVEEHYLEYAELVEGELGRESVEMGEWNESGSA